MRIRFRRKLDSEENQIQKKIASGGGGFRIEEENSWLEGQTGYEKKEQEKEYPFSGKDGSRGGFRRGSCRCHIWCFPLSAPCTGICPGIA